MRGTLSSTSSGAPYIQRKQNGAPQAKKNFGPWKCMSERRYGLRPVCRPAACLSACASRDAARIHALGDSARWHHFFRKLGLVAVMLLAEGLGQALLAAATWHGDGRELRLAAGWQSARCLDRRRGTDPIDVPETEHLSRRRERGRAASLTQLR